MPATRDRPSSGDRLTHPPANWRICELRELGEIVTGSTPRTARPEYYGGPFKFITPGDLGGGAFVTRSAKTLSAQGLAASRKLPRDSVLVVCIGASIGKTAITADEVSVTNQQINAILPNEKIIPLYLHYAFCCRSPGKI